MEPMAFKRLAVHYSFDPILFKKYRAYFAIFPRASQLHSQSIDLQKTTWRESSSRWISERNNRLILFLL